MLLTYMSDVDRLAADVVVTEAQQTQYDAIHTNLSGIAKITYSNTGDGTSTRAPNTSVSKAFPVSANSTYLAYIVNDLYSDQAAEDSTLYDVSMTVNLATSSTGANPVIITYAVHQHSCIYNYSETSSDHVTMNCLVPFTTNDTQTYLYITIFAGPTKGGHSWSLSSLLVSLIKLK